MQERSRKWTFLNTDTELLDELVCHLKCPGDFETAALINNRRGSLTCRLLKLRNVSYVIATVSAFKKTHSNHILSCKRAEI